MDWENIWQSIKNFFTNNGWNIVKFFAVLFIGIILIKLVINILKRCLNKTKIEKIAAQFFIGLFKFLLYLILILVLLKIVGIEVSGLVTALSAILLAVGVALEKNIANFANGIVIVATKMFCKGDYIIVDEVEGSITDINFLFTTLVTTDNRRITIPNSTIVNESVTNNGAYKTRRVQITFSVAYESDIELVKKIVTDVMKSNGKVYLDKDIFCRLKTMGDSSLNFYSYCWVDKEDYWNVYYYLMENVYNEFKRHGISVPYQQYEVRNRTDEVKLPIIGDSLPKREEKVRNVKEKFDLEDIDFVKLITHPRKNKKSNKKQSKNKKELSKSNEKKQNNVEAKVALKVETETKTKVAELEVVNNNSEKDDKK